MEIKHFYFGNMKQFLKKFNFMKVSFLFNEMRQLFILFLMTKFHFFRFNGIKNGRNYLRHFC